MFAYHQENLANSILRAEGNHRQVYHALPQLSLSTGLASKAVGTSGTGKRKWRFFVRLLLCNDALGFLPPPTFRHVALVRFELTSSPFSKGVSSPLRRRALMATHFGLRGLTTVMLGRPCSHPAAKTNRADFKTAFRRVVGSDHRMWTVKDLNPDLPRCPRVCCHYTNDPYRYRLFQTPLPLPVPVRLIQPGTCALPNFAWGREIDMCASGTVPFTVNLEQAPHHLHQSRQQGHLG